MSESKLPPDILPDHAGQCVVKIGQETDWKCHKCGKRIHGNKSIMKPSTGMFVDTNRNIWCRACFTSNVSPTLRRTSKNPDDQAPKVYEKSGRYYRRMLNKEKGYDFS